MKIVKREVLIYVRFGSQKEDKQHTKKQHEMEQKREKERTKKQKNNGECDGSPSFL